LVGEDAQAFSAAQTSSGFVDEMRRIFETEDVQTSLDQQGGA
jgi:hypothetical protein